MLGACPGRGGNHQFAHGTSSLPRVVKGERGGSRGERGVGCCKSVMRTNLVLLYRHTVDTPFDDALQLHPHVNRELGYDSNCMLTTHEVLFVDVQFKSGTTRRLYAELTPGQIAGFAADATKAVFWEPPASYSEISEHPGGLATTRTAFPARGGRVILSSSRKSARWRSVMS